MRRSSWPALLILVVVAATACGSAPVASHGTGAIVTSHGTGALPVAASHGQPVPRSAVQRLTALADRAVKLSGDHPVQWATAVMTTRAKALTSATPGDSDPSGGAAVVYLITIKGHFVCDLCSVPPRGRAPTGTYMSLVITAGNFRGESDFGLSHRPPPVSPASLGPVTYLRVHS
jgi:hypothetical protein